MKKLPLLLALLVLFSFGSVCAAWQYAQGTIHTVSKNLPLVLNAFDYPEMVYILDVDYLSGDGTFTKASYSRNILDSSVTVPQGTELTFRITVYNNTQLVQGFDTVVSNIGSEYDNINITYTLTNLKRPYTMDGVPGSDVTRIPAYQTHEFDITFSFAEGTADFTNATLNSLLHFIFKPIDQINPNHLNSPVNGALDAFKQILNTPESFNKLYDVMDNHILSFTGYFAGNVVGSSDKDTQVLNELFADNLHLMLTDPKTGALVKTDLTCMIKEADVYGDGTKEMTIYLTPDNLTEAKRNDTIQNVYVAVFTKVTDADGTVKWEQVGDLYHGTATCNDYDSNLLNGFDPSINTDSWRSSQRYHGVATGSRISAIMNGYSQQ